MKPLHERAIELVTRVTALAQSLARADMEVLLLHCDYVAWGSWYLELSRARPTATREELGAAVDGIEALVTKWTTASAPRGYRDSSAMRVCR
jgi:hypothetical protein